ncbi:nuclear transport factor 2 family protein [Variovorax sp. J31P207]|uniref:nuclear transport factor 2 family protein n=1 Tax=Variovorax sp. J31P207 TaxID=3053510 RepID=UPI002578BBD4|nr:nuclear transport factor 2 family protein [Variovorax sp. J31P207]MDM0070676.1 nuclear transport factor 2 family protein [Variovorax sp. J31P207]
MNQRRTFMIGVTATAILFNRGAGAQAKKASGAGTEGDLRNAIVQFEKAWNQHDVDAWLALMTEDVWFTQTLDYYERMKGKKAVKTTFEYDVKNTDLKWDVQRVRMMPDGTASVVLRQVGLIPPKTDGKYKREDVSEPSFSRWRLEGGKWKLFFFTSNKGWALDEMKKDGLN